MITVGTSSKSAATPLRVSRESTGCRVASNSGEGRGPDGHDREQGHEQAARVVARLHALGEEPGTEAHARHEDGQHERDADRVAAGEAREQPSPRDLVDERGGAGQKEDDVALLWSLH